MTYALFSDSTVSATGLKFKTLTETMRKKLCANGNYRNFIETKFSHHKDAENTWLACQGYSYEVNSGPLSTGEVCRRKLMVRQSDELPFYDKVALNFSTCDRRLLSGVRLLNAFR